MKPLKSLLILFSFSLFFSAATAQNTKINALALRNGCQLISAPTSFTKVKKHSQTVANWTPNALIDEKYETGFCSVRGETEELSFVFKLSEEFVLDELVFYNSKDKTYKGLNSHSVSVSISRDDMNSFKAVGTFILQEHKTSTFQIPTDTARWIKITLNDNYGHKEYIELMEVEANGYFAHLQTQAVRLNGTWQTQWGPLSLKENTHGLVYGCYNSSHGSLIAQNESRRVVNFNWNEGDMNSDGWAILVLNAEGTALRGVYGYNDNHDEVGYWHFDYKNDHVKDCNIDQQVSDVYPDLAENELRIIVNLNDRISKDVVNAEVELIGEDGNSYLKKTTQNGRCEFNIVKNTSYKLKISSNDYFTLTDYMEFSRFEKKSAYIVERNFGMDRLHIGQRIELKNIFFERGNDELNERSYEDLDKLVELLKEHPKMKIEIGGHTDNTGSARANLKLSQHRVDAVKQYLVSRGIRKQNIKGVGYGGSESVASNAHESTRKLNRRVEFKILKF